MRLGRPARRCLRPELRPAGPALLRRHRSSSSSSSSSAAAGREDDGDGSAAAAAAAGQVVVVGGGPVGLALGLLLARQGVRSTVVERLPRPSPHPQAHFLNIRSMEVRPAFPLSFHCLSLLVTAFHCFTLCFHCFSLPFLEFPLHFTAFPCVLTALQSAFPFVSRPVWPAHQPPGAAPQP